MIHVKATILAFSFLFVAGTSNSIAAVPGTQPRDMKILLLGVDGTEPGYQALKSFLDYLGTPYDAVLTRSQPLPALSDAVKGLYQGIVLSSGNLAYCDAAGCRSALSEAGWAVLDAYARDYRVRMAAFYAWPEKRYGLAATGSMSTDVTPASAVFTSAAAPVFSYLNRNNPLKVAYAWVYLATPAPEAGETTTPLLTIQGATVAALHTKADGRELMAFTFDSNPYLLHSQALNYGVFNWVTRGVFLGSRKIYLTAQNDDFFLPDDLFVSDIPACRPGGFTSDPTFDPATQCPSRRMTAADLDSLRRWQDNLNAQAQFKQFRTTLVFNGFGSAFGDPDVGAGDLLTAKAIELRSKFFWINHTYDHENLDCFDPVPNSGQCIPANYAQSLSEISQNLDIARRMSLPLDAASMVTPAISGLYNAEFLRAAKQMGIRYLVGDTSRPDGMPGVPNTGIRSAIEPSILIVPRRATNVFYNTYAVAPNIPGSLPDEYNYFFGPNGLFRVGGPGGPPFFSTVQKYSDIVERESDNLLSYMLRYEIYPTMWHQSNFANYARDKSLFADVVGAALAKFAKISTLPVISLQQSEIGKELEDRMGFLSAQVQATLTPGKGIALTAARPANVPITGICIGVCESYGGQQLSKITVAAGATVQIPVN